MPQLNSMKFFHKLQSRKKAMLSLNIYVQIKPQLCAKSKIMDATTEFHEVFSRTSIQEKGNAFSEHLRAYQTTIVCKIQDGFQYLSFVVFLFEKFASSMTPLFFLFVLFVNCYSLEWVWPLASFKNLCYILKSSMTHLK